MLVGPFQFDFSERLSNVRRYDTQGSIGLFPFPFTGGQASRGILRTGGFLVGRRTVTRGFLHPGRLSYRDSGMSDPLLPD